MCIKVLCGVLLMCHSIFSFCQTPRNILFEEFTSTNSNACALLDPNFDSLISSNSPQAILLKYPFAFQDIFYNQYPIASDQRIAYYATTSSVPQVFLDGNVLSAVSPALINQTTINNQLAVPAIIEIVLDHQLNNNLDSISINCTIINQNNTVFFSGRKLRLALIEDEILFPYSIGTNGQNKVQNIVRKMIPDVQGTILPALNIGDSISLQFKIELPEYLYDLQQLAVIAFVQNDNNKDIFQAQISPPKPLPNNITAVDLAVQNLNALPELFCQNMWTPGLLLNNYGSNNINYVAASYTLDSINWITDAYNNTLLGGQSDSLLFPVVSLNEGLYTVDFRIDSIFPQLDYNTSNQLIERNKCFVFDSNIDSFVIQDFQGYNNGTLYPMNAFQVNPQQHPVSIVDNSISSSISTPLGGFGQSNGCFYWNFWNMLNGSSSRLVLKNIDFSNRTVSNLQFNRAHAPVQNEADSLVIEVSLDCGQSWNFVQALTGTSLSTAAAHGSSFYPTASEWQQTIIDLNSYNGQSEVMISLRGISDYGNNLFIDDIHLTSTMLHTNTPLKSPLSYFFPNPVKKTLYPNPTITASDKIQYQIYNIHQQLIMSALLDRSHGIDVHTLKSGVYCLKWQYKNHYYSQKFIKTD